LVWALLSSALLGAFIGWITNVMTIRLIFRPRRPWRVGPVTFQGIVPRRRDEIAASLAHTVARELLEPARLVAAVDTPSHREALLASLRRELRTRFSAWPMFPWRDRVAAYVEDTVVREVVRYLDRVVRDPTWPERLMQYVPVEELIAERIRSFDLDEFERIIIGLSRRELRQIEWLGGLLGFFVGLVLPLAEMAVRGL
jgi:uncharacterized membrane protein YheB (UPF0754 family)